MLNFEVPDLYVKAYDNQFDGRQKTLFQALESAEKDCGKDVDVRTVAKTPKMKNKYNSSVWRSQVKPFRGKESIFKVPEEPPPRMRFKNIVSVAQNAANRSPRRGRWTKYSLETVDDMSDSSNARVAFSFLQELENRKQGSPENGAESVSLDQFKPVFQKRETTRRNDIKTNFQSTRRTSNESSNIPVQKNKSNNSTIVSGETTRPRITLHHLDDLEE